jgi:hypothetical protein
MRWRPSRSTRTQITTTSFIHTYYWGNFKGNPSVDG